MQVTDLAQAAPSVWGMDPKIVATAIVVVCYAILFTEKLNRAVADFMKDLDCELWKLGIYAKTKHNEVAPAQHELAPVFTTSNIAADHNQLTMEIMKKVALKHGLVCLLHEKPFAGVNGSGKHNNWSISSNDGQNLLDPGDTPMENMQFLTFLCAIIKGLLFQQTGLPVVFAGNG